MFNSKKFISIIIAVVMTFALSTAVFAAETGVEGEEADASVIMATGEAVDDTVAVDEEQETVEETADEQETVEETADEHEGHDHEGETTENKIVVSDTSNIIGIVVAIILPIAAIIVIIALIPKKSAPKKR